MKNYIYAISDVGKIRKNNEDNFFVNGYYREDYKINNFDYEKEFDSSPIAVFAVFDGMGGVQFGEEASGAAAAALNKYLQAAKNEGIDFNGKMAIRKINNSVCKVSRSLSAHSGSTIVMAVVKETRLQVINVGDSRAYLYRNGKLRQLSVDHNEAEMYRQMNMEVDIPNAQNVLTQHLGIEEVDFVLEPAVCDVITIEKNDIVLLCSDGLCGFVDDSTIESILTQSKTSIKEAANKLIAAALDAGGKDNITAMLICAG